MAELKQYGCVIVEKSAARVNPLRVEGESTIVLIIVGIHPGKMIWARTENVRKKPKEFVPPPPVTKPVEPSQDIILQKDAHDFQASCDAIWSILPTVARTASFGIESSDRAGGFLRLNYTGTIDRSLVRALDTRKMYGKLRSVGGALTLKGQSNKCSVVVRFEFQALEVQRGQRSSALIPVGWLNVQSSNLLEGMVLTEIDTALAAK